MTAFRRVVVGLDASESAREALALAQRLGDQDGLLVLACVDAHRSFRLPHGHVPESTAALLDAARAEVAADRAVSCVERAAGPATRGLTEVAEEQRADLIVLGSRRSSRETRITPGRTALRLLAATHPVVVMPRSGVTTNTP